MLSFVFLHTQPSNAARGALASSPATPYATQQGHGQRTPRLGSRALPLHSQESSPALESQASQLDSPRGSVMSLDLEHVGEMYDTEGESVRVFVRVRPHNQEELRLGECQSAGVVTRDAVLPAPVLSASMTLHA
jgi:hypothetical protein